MNKIFRDVIGRDREIEQLSRIRMIDLKLFLNFLYFTLHILQRE